MDTDKWSEAVIENTIQRPSGLNAASLNRFIIRMSSWVTGLFCAAAGKVNSS